MTSGSCAAGRCARRKAGIPCSSTSSPESLDTVASAVTRGLADLRPGPELAKECAARRREIWTIMEQLRQVVRFTEHSVKDEELHWVGQHSHRLRLVGDLLQGLSHGAQMLERFDRDWQNATECEQLEQEYVSMQSCACGLHLRIDRISLQLMDGRDECARLASPVDPNAAAGFLQASIWSVAGRLISPLLGAAHSAVALLGAGALFPGGSGAGSAVEAGLIEPKPSLCEDSFTQSHCIRCQRHGARLFCEVALRSIFDADPPCRHGPFCRCCQGSLTKTVIATCVCRALIAYWHLEEEPQ